MEVHDILLSLFPFEVQEEEKMEQQKHIMVVLFVQFFEEARSSPKYQTKEFQLTCGNQNDVSGSFNFLVLVALPVFWKHVWGNYLSQVM
ncbi:hypothetical protein WN943_002608 [Citrus x changshan-huyou]